MRRLTTAMVMVCCALTTASCGDDEDEPTPVATATTATAERAPTTEPAPTPGTTEPPRTTEAPSARAAFIAEAEAICDRADAASEDIEEPDARTARAAVGYFGQLLPLAERLLSDHGALTPPTALRADWERLLSAERDATDIIRSTLRKARANDASFARETQRIEPVGDAIEKAAEKLGLDDC